MAGAIAIAVAVACGGAAAAHAYEADLAWTAASDAAGYRVYMRAGSQAFDGGTDVGDPAIGADGAVHYRIAGLASDVAYAFTVSAYNDAGESPLSNELALLLPATPTATASPTATATPTRTRTPAATATRPPSVATPTATASRRASATASPTATFTPTAIPTFGCTPVDGMLPAVCGLSGHLAARGTADPVAGAVVALRDGATEAAAVASDATGGFAFAAPDPAGTWSVEPRKLGDAGTGVSALDAALVLRAAAGIAPLDDLQTLACDVTGNGSITSLDASRILQVAVGLLPKLPVAERCGSDWAFVPQTADSPTCTVTMPVPAATECEPGRIAFDASAPELPVLSFTAVLFGDCTGNWHAATSGAALQRRRLAVAAGPPRRRTGGRWLVPLTVAGVSDFRALEVRLAYDDHLLRPTAARAVGAAEPPLVYQHVTAPGEVSIALASAAPLDAGRMPAAVVLFDALERTTDAPPVQVLAATVDEMAAAP